MFACLVIHNAHTFSHVGMYMAPATSRPHSSNASQIMLRNVCNSLNASQNKLCNVAQHMRNFTIHLPLIEQIGGSRHQRTLEQTSGSGQQLTLKQKRRLRPPADPRTKKVAPATSRPSNKNRWLRPPADPQTKRWLRPPADSQAHIHGQPSSNKT